MAVAQNSLLFPPLKDQQWTGNPDFTSLRRDTWVEEKGHRFLVEDKSLKFFQMLSGLRVLEVNYISKEWFVIPE